MPIPAARAGRSRLPAGGRFGRPERGNQQPVIETCHVIDATPDRVFAVLADGWSYASWVVGAAHIRDVDRDWPEVGTRVHHKVGPWPAQIADQTVVRAMERDRMLELNAQAWPLGAATVRIELEPVSPTSTRVRMLEALTSGIGKLLPEPVQFALLRPRNTESLRHLDDIAVHRPLRV